MKYLMSILTIALFVVHPESTLAQTPVPVGEEFLVGIGTLVFDVEKTAVGVAEDGSFVITWTTAEELLLQPYNSLGVPQPGDFQVSEYTFTEVAPSLTMNMDGSFAISWTGGNSFGTDTEGASVEMRRFDSLAGALGVELQVNTYTTGSQGRPSVAVDEAGEFIAVWESDTALGDADSGIRGQRFDSIGNLQGSEFAVNTYTPSFQQFAKVDRNDDGAFVVVWRSDGSPGNDDRGYSVVARRFTSDGTPQAGDFQVNTYTSYNQSTPAVAVVENGDFFIVWQSERSTFDRFNYSIQGRRFTSDGSAVGEQILINTSYTTADQKNPEIVADGAEFVVVWQSYGSITGGGDYNGYSIQGRRFNSQGSPVGEQFQVNSYTTFWQIEPSIGINGRGQFIVVWETEQDYTIRGQRFEINQITLLQDGFESGDTTRWSNTVP